MGLKAVIFDMDGVIVDTEPVYLRTTAELLKRLKFHIRESELEKYKGIDSLEMWQDIKNHYNLEASAEELFLHEKKMMEAYYSKGELKIIMPTLSLIKEACRNNYKTAVASTSEKVNILHVLERLRIKHCFDVVISRNDVDKGKPFPDIYLLAARRLGVCAHDCVVIEDSAAGTVSAKAAGMKVIRYASGGEYGQDECKAELIVKDIREITLLSLLKVAEM